MAHTLVDVWDLVYDFVLPRFACPLPLRQELPPRKVYMWSLLTFKNMVRVSREPWWKYTGTRYIKEHHFTICNFYKARVKFKCVEAFGFCGRDSDSEREFIRNVS